VSDQFTEDPVSADDELAAAEAEAGVAPGDDDTLVIVEPEAQPIGRSWAFDWTTRRFVRAAGGGVAETRGLDTLRGWIIKALKTPRGGAPVLPDDYGVDGGGIESLFGTSAAGLDVAELTERITDALTVHPRIAAVRDVEVAVDESDEAAAIALTVVLDSDEELLIEEAV
jgi:Protein of unknown function (DUF2634)